MSKNILSFSIDFFSFPMLIACVLILIMLIAVVAFRRNYIIQVRVSLLMDNESDVFNKKGFIHYCKKRKKKYLNSSLVVLKIDNLNAIHTYYKDKNLLMYSMCGEILKCLDKNETLGRLDFNKFILLLNTKDQEVIKAKIKKVDEALSNFDLPDYGKYTFKTIYAINFDLTKNYSRSCELTLLTLLYSTVRESNLIYYAENVKNFEEKLVIMNKLKESALQNGKIVPFIQPKVSLRTGRIVAGEILCRWVDDNNNVIYTPDEFIPLFEETGFITKVDLNMFEQTCRFLTLLRQKGYNNISLSSNFSQINFSRPNFIDHVQEIVKSTQVNTENIEVEVTESALMESSGIYSQVIMKLKSLGFKISMDDFGKEYSSLSSLVDNPFDIIKVDRMFLANNLSIDRERHIISNIIDLLTNIKCTIVLEGVENQATVDEIAKISLDVILQGFFFSKPIPLTKFETMLNTVYKFNYPEVIKNYGAINMLQPIPKNVDYANDKQRYEMELLRQQMEEMRRMYEKGVQNQIEREKNQEIERLKNQLEDAKRAQNQQPSYQTPPFYDSRLYHPEKEDSSNRELEEIKKELQQLREHKKEQDQNLNNQQVDVNEIIMKLSQIGNSKIDSFIEQSNRQTEELKKELERERREREELESIITELSREEQKPNIIEVTDAEIIREQEIANQNVNLNLDSLRDDREEEDDDEDDDEEEIDLKKPILTLEEVEAIIKSYKDKYFEEWNSKAKEELKDGYYEVVNGLKYYRGRIKKNLPERLKDMSPEQKMIYNIIKNELMQYNGVKEKLTNSFECFYLNKKQIAKVSLTKKRIRIYLALNPSDYPNATYPHKDVSKKKVHEKTPFYALIKSKLSVKRIKFLITDLMNENHVKVQDKYSVVDYANMYKYYQKK